MNRYRYKYDNDTGPHDESFYEFWSIEDEEGNVVGRMNSENMAIIVVDLLNKNTGWIGSKVICGTCNNEWIAVFHSTTDKLECPNCTNLSSFEIIK